MSNEQIKNQLNEMIKFWGNSSQEIYNDDEEYKRPKSNRSADSLVNSIINNKPFSPATMTDYGFDMFCKNRKEVLCCLCTAILKDGVTADQLHKACLNNKLNELLGNCESVKKSSNYEIIKQNGGIQNVYMDF